MKRAKKTNNNKTETVTITVTKHEYDHVLAALRAYQTLLYMSSGICQDVEDIATEHGEQLTADEIGDLCVKINTQERK